MYMSPLIIINIFLLMKIYYIMEIIIVSHR